ncbi:hypothetical protein [Alteromonas oceanisediminis]|uniref:hypothetical protein n=1 Tax=Alteromonas oceanisediminis TaxID=2836180 RepID=UPI001BD9DBF2|nr:hypothetical protein [Alteromonas oceanisediminis]MBT0585052.1 hypothetical protein [Alteromonas oceanisediminis]
MAQRPSLEPISWEKRDLGWRTADYQYQTATEAQIAALDVAQLWGVSDTPKGEATSDDEWALRGIIEEGESRIAIIDVDAEATNISRERFVRFREGARLPSGSTLIRIAKNHVEYETNGVKHIKRLYE